MKVLSPAEIKHVFDQQKSYLATNQTKDVSFRLFQLKRLKTVILENQVEIEKALWNDLRKSPEEAFLTEIGIVLNDLNHHIRNVKKWSKTKRVVTPLFLQPSQSRMMHEPLGLSLIISPWNYPFQLLFLPLLGAISSGCCAILKPSPETPAIAKLMEKMVAETFDPGYIAVIQGGKETNTLLLQERFDFIFFTGSSRVGKIIMKAAADHLTPMVLELGGKSPCLVGKEANIDIAAKRIIWGKLINAGQTCIAPDYVYVHESLKDELLEKMVFHMKKMYGEDFQKSKFYPRIVNENAVSRLEGLMTDGTIYYGGQVDKADRFISPTILDSVKQEDPIMQEEIFGPLLPILTYKNIEEAIGFINENEKPLAFYYFGSNTKAKELMKQTMSGGVCINDALLHIANHHLPFGGVGNSGLAKYHGKESFLAFSNQRGIVSTPTWVDLSFKYAPFKWFKFIKRLF